MAKWKFSLHFKESFPPTVFSLPLFTKGQSRYMPTLWIKAESSQGRCCNLVTQATTSDTCIPLWSLSLSPGCSASYKAFCWCDHEGNRWWSKCLGPCHPKWETWGISRFWTWAWPTPGPEGILGMNQKIEVFFSLHLSFILCKWTT